MKTLLLTLAFAATTLYAQPADLVQKAQNGDAQAQFELGVLYIDGEGVGEVRGEVDGDHEGGHAQDEEGAVAAVADRPVVGDEDCVPVLHRVRDHPGGHRGGAVAGHRGVGGVGVRELDDEPADR